jgi:hypothetical protein
MTAMADSNEVTALDELKGKLDDPKYPALQLSRDLQAHLETYPQAVKHLAIKLGRSRPFLSQVLALHRLPDEAKPFLEGVPLTYPDIQAINGLGDASLQIQLSRELKEGKIKPGTLHGRAKELSPARPSISSRSADVPSNAQKNEKNASNTPSNGSSAVSNTSNTPSNARKNEKNASNTQKTEDAGGSTNERPLMPTERDHPLLRQTANFWARAFHIDRDSHPKVVAGDLLVDWVNATGRALWRGWPRILITGLVLALALNGVWHVKKDARDWAAQHWIGAGVLSLLSRGVGLPAPQMALAGYEPGHKFHLVWTPVAPHMSYKVLWSSNYTGRRSGAFFSNVDKPVTSPGAVVDLSRLVCGDSAALAVRTVAPDGSESGLSNVIMVSLTEDNVNFTADELSDHETAALTATVLPTPQGTPPVPTPHPTSGGGSNHTSNGHHGSPTTTSGMTTKNTSVPPTPATPTGTPLVNGNDVTQVGQAFVPQTGGFVQRVGNAVALLAGKAVTSGGSPAAKKLAPGPQHLRWHPIPGSDNIIVEWDPMPGCLFNFHAAPWGPNPSFDVDGALMRNPAVIWTPPPHAPKINLFYVTAVNAQGEESAPSQRLLVDNR